MKVLRVFSDFVEVLWVDDNEIEFIPYQEFIDKYGTQALK
jgi:hypothetical protein